MSSISTAKSVWFARGFLIGALLCGAGNAVSYFVRSDGWGNLLGRTPQRYEALGFPALMWEQGNSYGGYYVDYRAMSVNIALAAAAGSLLGLTLLALRGRLNRLVRELEQAETEGGTRRSFQFSLRGLFLSTFLTALGVTVMRQGLATRPEALGAIFLLGPWLLVGLALAPRGIPWQQRVALLIPLTFGLILVAVLLGATLAPERDVEDVLRGIYLCWTPQAALAALAITGGLLVTHRGVLLAAPTPESGS